MTSTPTPGALEGGAAAPLRQGSHRARRDGRGERDGRARRDRRQRRAAAHRRRLRRDSPAAVGAHRLPADARLADPARRRARRPFRRRRIFVIGTVWFAAASVLCAPAERRRLIAARVLQGVGAALLTPGAWRSSRRASTDDRARASAHGRASAGSPGASVRSSAAGSSTAPVALGVPHQRAGRRLAVVCSAAVPEPAIPTRTWPRPRRRGPRSRHARRGDVGAHRGRTARLDRPGVLVAGAISLLGIVAFGAGAAPPPARAAPAVQRRASP